MADAPKRERKTKDHWRAAGEQVRQWRKQRGFTLGTLDEWIGASPGTWAQIETGKLLPPKADDCAKIDHQLRLAAGTTWGELARARLLRLDPEGGEILTWHDAQVQAAANLSPGLHLLVTTVRDVAARRTVGGLDGVARSLAGLLAASDRAGGVHFSRLSVIGDQMSYLDRAGFTDVVRRALRTMYDAATGTAAQTGIFGPFTYDATNKRHQPPIPWDPAGSEDEAGRLGDSDGKGGSRG